MYTGISVSVCGELWGWRRGVLQLETRRWRMRTRLSLLSVSLSFCLWSLTVSHTPRPSLFLIFSLLVRPECRRVFAVHHVYLPTNLNIYGWASRFDGGGCGILSKQINERLTPQNRGSTFLSLSHRTDTNLYTRFSHYLQLTHHIMIVVFTALTRAYTRYKNGT